MEYVLLALGDSGPIKARLSKLRHLESLFFFLLIVALLFFQVFQHHQLRAELQARKPDLLELQERLPHLDSQIEELRRLLSDQTALVHLRLLENKQLTLELARQLGLPCLAPQDQTQLEPPRDIPTQQQKESRYEVIEIESNGEEDEEEHADGSEEGLESDSFPLEEVITSSEQAQKCTYMDYLKEEQRVEQRPSWSPSGINQFRINTSSYARRTGRDVQNQRLESIKRVAEELVKSLLLIGGLVAVVLLLTLQKRRRGRHAKTFLRQLWRRVWPEEKRKTREEREEKGRVEAWREGKEWREGREWLEGKESLVL